MIRRRRHRQAPDSHEMQDDDDGEILIREKTGRLLESLPFQAPNFSQTQPDDDDNDDDDNNNNSGAEEHEPHAALVSSRYHGRWRQRKRGRAFFQPTVNDDSAHLPQDAKEQDDDLPLKNDFAELEAMLATQDDNELNEAAHEKSAQLTENPSKQAAALNPESSYSSPLNATGTGNSPPEQLPRHGSQEDVLDIPMHEADVEGNDAVTQAHHFQGQEEAMRPLERPAAVMGIGSSVQKVKDTTETAKSLLEKSRRFVKKKIKSAADRSFRPPKKAKGPVAVKNAKSIVGSRPTHWGASSSMRPLTNAHRLQRHAKRSKPDLAAALSRSGGSSMLASLSSPAPKRTRNVHQTGAVTTPPHSGTQASHNSGEQHQNSCSEERDHSATQPAGNEPVSFAPSFVSLSTIMTSPHAARNEEEQTEAVEDGGGGDDDDGNVFPNPLRSPPSPSRARKGSRSRATSSAAGALSKRLSAIRDGIKGDTVRFQSGQYPFSMSSLDMNDPRNRAKTYMDVTILGNSMDRQQQRVTLLGFVHTFAYKAVAAAAAASKVESEEASSSTPTNLQPNSLAWICFTYETAREKKVGVGSQLRIYNAVPVPLTVSLVHNDDENKNRLSASPHSNVKWIVLCTSLCENYPSCLPKLPNVETILSSE